MFSKNKYLYVFVSFLLTVFSVLAREEAVEVVQPAGYQAIFVHGLGGKAFHANDYKNLVGCPISGKNGPEWNKDLYGFNVGPQQSCLAQEGDIEVVVEQLKENTEKNNMLVGISKGGATVFTTVGWLAVNAPEYLKNIKAVIVDSPFATPEHVAAKVVGGTLGSFGEELVLSSLCKPILKMVESKIYPNYDPKGITPLKAVKEMWQNVDKNMVIILIASQVDELISVNDSRKLYIELKKLGFKNLYLIEAKSGRHGAVCWGSSADYILKNLCMIYLNHDLPMPNLFPEEFASMENLYNEKGKTWLANIQPTVEVVNKRMNSGSSLC